MSVTRYSGILTSASLNLKEVIAVPFGIAIVLLLFLIVTGLHAPHLDNLENWVFTFEFIPLRTYIFLKNLNAYITGPTDNCNYISGLLHMSFSEYDSRRSLISTINRRTIAKRNYGMHFLILFVKGKP